MERIRFVIITVPPASVAARIEAFRGPAADVSGSRIAMAYPPHVTLRTGALVPAPELVDYVEGLRDALGEFSPFEVRTTELVSSTYVESGEEKCFVGYGIEKSAALMELHNTLLSYTPYIKRKQPEFEPHLSIAYGDLTPDGQSAIMNMVAADPGLAPESLSWTCDNVGLYHRVNGEWVPYEVISAVAPPFRTRS